MEKCWRCGADTGLYDNGVPICVPCAERVDAQREHPCRSLDSQPPQMQPEQSQDARN